MHGYQYVAKEAAYASCGINAKTMPRASGQTTASPAKRNPAYKRAATRRYELPEQVDEDSGFRCAKRVPACPDADFWLSQL